MPYFLGIDVGSSKCHALICDQTGRAVGFAAGGSGNWEIVGYDGLTSVLAQITSNAIQSAGIQSTDITAAGMGMSGFDWESQRAEHLAAIRAAGITCPVGLVNDSILGLLAGAEQGWGISLVAGSGGNCRGWSRDHCHEARIVGGHPEWSDEWVGGVCLVYRGLRAVIMEWTRRGKPTSLTSRFLSHFQCPDLSIFVENLYTDQYIIFPTDAVIIFEEAWRGDSAALEAIHWQGEQIGNMAVGVIRQLQIEQDAFEVILIGGLFEGHPLLTEAAAEVIHSIAPQAELKRLSVPPVVGGSNSKSKKSRGIGFKIETILHKKEEVVPSIKDHITCQSTQIFKKSFPLSQNAA